MDKAIKYLKITRKGAAIAASLLLFMGILLDVIFRLIGISSVIGHTIAGVGISLFAVLFGLTVAICLIDDFKKEKEKKAEEAAPKKPSKTAKVKKSFIEQSRNFLETHKNTIRLFLGIFSLCLLIFFAFRIFMTKDAWVFYYFLMIAMWVLFVNALLELLYSADKKTFITHAALNVATLAMLIVISVFSHNMFYDPLASVDLKLLDYLILGITVFFTVLYLIITSDNDVMKTKKTRNFGIGLALLCVSIFIFYSQKVGEYIVGKWDASSTMSDKLYYLKIGMDVIMYIVIGVVMLNMVNVTVNSKHYLKTRNYLGLVDIAASFVSVILCLVGFLAFADYLAVL